MKLLLSRINIILGLRIAPQDNGLFKWEAFKFVKPLRIKLSAKIQMTQQAIFSLFFMKATIAKHHSSSIDPKT
jgi:hypothetical protein